MPCIAPEISISALLGCPQAPMRGRLMPQKGENVMLKKCKETQAEKQPTKRRKPQDRSKLTRNSQVQIRLTEAEVARLKAAAQENDMTLADFVMSSIHQRRRIVVPGAGELRAELIRVGINLNQALKFAYIMREERNAVDIVSIEHTSNQVADTLEKLNAWLTMWDVYLAYQNKNGRN